MYRRRAAAVAGLLLAASIPLNAQATAPADQVGQQLASVLLEAKLAGAVWALVDSTGVRTGAAGIHDRAMHTRLTPEARVHVGSVAKMMLALGALRLATTGKLDLGATIASTLPELEIDNPWSSTNPLRIHHLLDHTSGLDDARLWQVFSLRATPSAPLIEGIAPGGTPLRLRTPPGRRFSYSNTGWAIVGLLIERVTGEPYEPFLDRELLAPLGMYRSTFAFTTQSGSDRDSSLAMGHFDNGLGHAAVPQFLRPAGQFTTTAADMGRLASFMLGDGTIDGMPFIAPELLSAMGQPVGTEASDAGVPGGYRLGLARRDRHGVVGYCHGGDTIGYHAMFCLFRLERKAFFVSVNTDSEGVGYNQIDAALVDALQLNPAVDLPAESLSVTPSEWNGWYVPAPGRFEMFAYLDRLFGATRLRWDGEAAALSPVQGSARVLKPAGGRLFTAEDRSTRSHALLDDSTGTRLLTDGFSTFRRVPFVQLLGLWISLAAGVLGLGYIAIAGLVRLLRRRPGSLAAPLVVIGLLVVSGLLLAGQPFLAAGDPTPGSFGLAIGTGLLPLAVGWSLIRLARARAPSQRPIADGIALFAVAQWLVVLAWWGLLPFRLWV